MLEKAENCNCIHNKPLCLACCSYITCVSPAPLVPSVLFSLLNLVTTVCYDPFMIDFMNTAFASPPPSPMLYRNCFDRNVLLTS